MLEHCGVGAEGPDNPIAESGVLSELSQRGMASRRGTSRSDVNHQWMDPTIVGVAWVAAGAGAPSRSPARRAGG